MNAAESPGAAALQGREAAYLAVLDVMRGRGFAAERLRALRSAGRHSSRASGLATRIALGTIRHAVTIEHVLSAVARFDQRRLRDRLRAIFYAAAYQVIWMDRVPVFAAVNEAVNQAARHVGGRSPGMVNAVLRSLTRAVRERRAPWQRLDPTQVRVRWGQACVFDKPVLPPADAEEHGFAHLAAATGERLTRFEELVSRHGAEQAEQIAWASQAVPVTVLQRNTLRVDPAEFGGRLGAVLGDQAELTEDAAFVPAAVRVVDTEPFADGLVFVQDPTAHAAAVMVAAQPDERVLDLCAAPGGKSVTMALGMRDRGEVVACDASAERLARVQENVTRLGLTCIRTARLPADDDASLGTFDAALVDVPCSNSGVVARRPEARLGLTSEKLQSLVRVQKDLLRTAAQHVRPAGRLVYSTCSLEPEENEQVVEWFLAEHDGWHLDTQQTTFPAWGPQHSDWRDGGYAARLVRERDQ